MYDVIIVGGGPAGLSAALNFGRGLATALVIDENQPRNKVTTESHGYLTQDGVTPTEFRQRAQSDLVKYDTVETVDDRVENIKKDGDMFIVTTQKSTYQSRQVLLATGLREFYPDIKNFEQFYGKSVFYCPWCDGYEMRHQRIAIMVDEMSIDHIVMLLSNWSDDLLICTNGKDILTEAHKSLFLSKGYAYKEAVITEMTGQDEQVQQLHFDDHTSENIGGMIAAMKWDTDYDFLKELDIHRDDKGQITTDQFSETSVKGLFVSGETKANFARQLINAAADGGDVAKYMIMKRLQEDFYK